MFTPGTNPVEKFKSQKDGLDILNEIDSIAAGGTTKLSPEDGERLKWIGTFLRKRTPGFFMMRVRITGGRSSSKQLFALADISERLGNGILDITTRQQIELRAIHLESVPQILKALKEIDLTTLQTGMDNIRNVNTCPLSGLTPNELFDAYPTTVAFTNMFLNNKEFTNLPRKMNVTFTGCLENCTHPESQDIGLIPATKIIHGYKQFGFNLFVGGKMGSGGLTLAESLDCFVLPEESSFLAAEIALLFRDYGARVERTRCRLAFLIESLGIDKFRSQLEEQYHKKTNLNFRSQGKDERWKEETDHIGVSDQKQEGLCSIGLCVPVGRTTSKQLRELGFISERYGTGEVRFTSQQNAILVNIPKNKIKDLLEEPLLSQFSPSPTPLMRRMVSCTGIDYCNLALIETKGISLKVIPELEKRLGREMMEGVRIYWSGCAAGCGNHHTADIGLQGIKANIDGKIVDAVHIFVGGKTGPNARAAEKMMELVPVSLLPDVLELILKNMHTLKKVRRDMDAESRVVMVPAYD